MFYYNKRLKAEIFARLGKFNSDELRRADHEVYDITDDR